MKLSVVRTCIMHVIVVNLAVMQLGEHLDSTVYLLVV